MGEESVWAAEASECAADQDAFWEYHDLLFNRQTGENQGDFSKENLKKYAEELDLNADEFNDCLDSGKYTALIEEDNTLARQIGVRSTPAFLVNGQPIIGAQPYENFKQVIDVLLDQARSGS